MASEEKEGSSSEEHPKKKNSKKWIIIILLLLLFVGGGIGAYLVLSKKNTTDVPGEEQTKEEELSEEDQLPPALLPLDPLIVNLKDKNSYLKITLQLELFEPEVPKTMENDTGKIKDAIIGLLSSKDVDDLLSSDGKKKLKQEIVETTNEVLGGESISSVYITEFIIQ